MKTNKLSIVINEALVNADVLPDSLHNAIVADIKASQAAKRANDKSEQVRDNFNGELDRLAIPVTHFLSPRGKDNGATSTLGWFDNMRRFVIDFEFKTDVMLFDSPVKSLSEAQKKRKKYVNQQLSSRINDWGKSYAAYLEVDRLGNKLVAKTDKQLEAEKLAAENELLESADIKAIETGDAKLDKSVKKLIEALVSIQANDGSTITVDVTKGVKMLRNAIGILTTPKF